MALPLTPALQRLAEAATAALDADLLNERARCDAMRDAMAALLDSGDLPEDACASLDGAAVGNLLYADPAGRFHILGVVFPEGTSSGVHHHGCWGVIGYLRGGDEETRYAGSDRPREGDDTDLDEVSRHVWHQGDITYLLPDEGDGWHRVRNPGPGDGVSIHVLCMTPSDHPHLFWDRNTKHIAGYRSSRSHPTAGRPPLQPPAELVDRVEHAMGRRATQWRTPHTGLSAAHRFAVTFEDGTSAFVKAATDVQTGEWLRTERTVLAAVDDDFAPTILHWHDGLLITEDLTDAYWPADHPGADGPVTWLPGQVDALIATLRRVAGAAPDLPLPAVCRAPMWPRIAVDPERFGVLPHLVEPLLSAEAAAEFDGDALVHNDVRSDNVCFAGERVVLVDWSTQHRGNALVDVAQLAPTLAIEGGPDPYDILRDAPLAAWQAGVLVARAANAEGPAWLCDVLRRLASVALIWATRCLNLD